MRLNLFLDARRSPLGWEFDRVKVLRNKLRLSEPRQLTGAAVYSPSDVASGFT